MDKPDLSALGNPEVATNWPKIYALIGETLDRVAGCSCANFKIRFTKRKPTHHHPIFGPQVALGISRHQRKSARVWVAKPDAKGCWVSDHYHTFFHEIGHLAWGNPSARLVSEQSEGVQWLTKGAHLLGGMAYAHPYRVVEVLTRGILPVASIAEVFSEYQADVFALRVASRLAHRPGPFQLLVQQIWESVWEKVSKESRLHYPLIIRALWRTKGDLEQVAQEAKHLSALELLQWCASQWAMQRSAWYRMREELSHFMVKRWGVYLSEDPEKAEGQYQLMRAFAEVCGKMLEDRELLLHIQSKHNGLPRCFPRAVVRRGTQRLVTPDTQQLMGNIIRRQQQILQDGVRQGLLADSWAKALTPLLEILLGMLRSLAQTTKQQVKGGTGDSS